MPETIEHEASPLPFVIGVTGHRHLRPEDEGALRESVAGVLRSVRGPHTPIVVLSTLAAGAHQLVSEVALSSGARLIAALPLPPALYAEDFAGAEDRSAGKRFDELRRHPLARTMIVPMLRGLTEASVSRAGPERARQYAAANAWIVRNSQLLIALTDGGAPRGPAGSAWAVRWQLRGLPRRFAAHRSRIDAAAVGPVWRIVARRSDGEMAANLVGQLHKRYPRSALHSPEFAAQREQDIREQFDEYNRDVCRILGASGSRRPPDAARIEAAGAALLGDDAARVERSPAGAALLERFGEADVLAQVFQRLVARVARALFGLALAGSFLFTMFAHSAAHPWTILLGYVAALLVAVLVYWFCFVRLDWERKRLDYRALAEGLRVLLFWKIAGIADRPSDYYLRLQRNDLDWIREALAVWHLVPGPAASTQGEASSMDEAAEPASGVLRGATAPAWPGIVARWWIDAQRAYFARRFEQNRQLHEWARHLTATLIAAGLLAAAALCCAVILDPGGAVHPVDGAWPFLITGTALAAGILRGVVDRSRYLGRELNGSRLISRLSRSLGVVAGAAVIVFAARSLHEEGWGSEALVRIAALGVVVGLSLGPPGRSAMASSQRHRTVAGLAGWIGPPLRDAGILLGALLPLGPLIGRALDPGHPHLVEVLIVESALLIVLAGVLRAYAEVRAYESEARRYEAMAETFATAGPAFSRLWRRAAPSAAGEARRLLLDLGRDALVEHGEWLLIHRDRPFGVVTAG